MTIVKNQNKLEIAYKLLNSLIVYAKNARTHSAEQVDEVAASIKQFGWTNPILIDERGEVIAGHGRLLAAEQLGMEQVPTITLSGLTGAAAARRLYRHVSVNKAIRDAMEAREKRTHITQDAVLNWWWDIATANANEISEFRRLCCHHCWGIENKYQWINEQEYQEESEKRTNNGKPAPLDDGGYGFDSTLDPNPDCPRCNGEGQGRAHFHDSRDLSISARRLYAGVKQGKFGLEVITRNQDDALKMVGQHLGMLKNKTEISGPDGGAINQVNYTPEDYSKAQQMLEGKLPGLD